MMVNANLAPRNVFPARLMLIIKSATNAKMAMWLRMDNVKSAQGGA